ncbi:tetratricopeptide repeat protein [Ohtaekwangia koreensis]|uniref:Tetratricopeptide repeat-containing protein n=1 Tax=Ohtaekwangia koreensis TaxID=688867 RepID=A0A1T5M1S4_9BACT|nr:tetratricopeptide repeat protein [Ohtaekwangia koreensis]SKC82180.1 Tetratricopeptide repeat-containing protein [Ohtaekwangia koreensis]
MKKITVLLLLIIPGIVLAQKEAKPNINKALTALKSGKLDEAKSIIDAATTYEKTMNDGKTWFYRGVIYGALDTTSSYNATEDLGAVAAASLKKAEELSNGKSATYFVQDNNGGMILYDQAITSISNSYLVKGDKAFNAENFKEALKQFEKGIAFKASKPDTTFYEYAGYAAYNSDERQKTMTYLAKYAELGGRRTQALTMPALLAYEDQNFEAALASAQQVLKIIPNHKDMKAVELNSLIQLKKYDLAAQNLQASVKANPNDAQSLYLLGVLNTELGKMEDAKANFEAALKIQPDYFDAQFNLSNYYLVEIDKTTQAVNALGISAANAKKKQELVQKRVKQSEVAIPYLEKAEKMKIPSKDAEIELLNKLSLLYYYIADDKNNERVTKRLKALGVED